MIANLKLFCLAMTLGILAASMVEAKPAKCLLSIEGEIYIDGVCDFEPLSGTGGDFRITGPKARYFAYLYVESQGIGDGHWNGAIGESRAHTPLGTLKRDGACWTNDTAKLCAW